MNKIALYSKRVLWRDALAEATIFIEGDKVTDVQSGRVERPEFHLEDAGTDVIMPGLIDAHVHINEPGRTSWEGFDTATKAAAAGGITTLVDMPLNSTPVTITKENFNIKLNAAEGKCHVNCGFWGGVVPDNVDDLGDLLSSGVQGIKAFLTHSGIDDFPNVTEEDLIKAMPVIKKQDAILLAHCELDSAHEDMELLEKNPDNYMAYLRSRPKAWEDKAIALMIRLCERYKTRTHIVHLSSSDSIAQIRAAKNQGLPITVETCPHYLYFNAEDIPDGSTIHKCAPPIRERSNNNLLWEALREGLIDFIASDHSPAPPEIKEIESGNFKKAWGGIAGLQFGLPAIWTNARTKGFSIIDVAKWMSENVAKWLDWENVKGKIEIGYDSDLVIWDPEASFTVSKDIIYHRHKISPYLNEKLYGMVKQTYVAGNQVYKNGEVIHLSKGRLIMKN